MSKKSILETRSLKNNKEKIRRLVSDPKVIYTDVDGTLLGPNGSLFFNSRGKHSLWPARAVVAAHQRNLDVVMVSGRSRRQLFGDARLLGFRNYIAELGTELVYDLGARMVLNMGKDYPPSNHFTSEGILRSGAVELLFQAFPKALEHHTPWSEGRECTLVFRGYIDLKRANDLLKEKGFNYLKIIDNGIIGQRGTLNQNLPEVHAYHLLPVSAGKQKGVKRDRELRGIAKQETAAIGDALSDLEFAAEVGALFLVRNAFKKGSSQILDAIQSTDNIFITEGEMGIGWAEAVLFLLGDLYPEFKS